GPDLPKGVEQGHFHLELHRVLALRPWGEADLARLAEEEFLYVLDGDGKADRRAADLGHDHADEPALLVDHGTAAVAGVDFAGQLNRHHAVEIVLADAGDRRHADRDGRVAARRGRQPVPERKAERVDAHRLDDRRRLAEVDRPGQVLDARDLEDGEVRL